MRRLRLLLVLILAFVFALSVPVYALSEKINKNLQSTVAETSYYLVPNSNRNVCLGVNTNKTKGEIPKLKALAISDRNRWYIEKSVSGTYCLINYSSGYRLGTKHNTTKVNGVIRQNTIVHSNGKKGIYAGMRWYIMKHKGSYIIQSAISKNVMGMKNFSLASGNTPVLQKWANKKGQKWLLVPYKTGKTPKQLLNEMTSSSSTKTTDTKTTSTKTTESNKTTTTKTSTVSQNASISSSARRDISKTINGKRTLTAYLHNAFVPCGRTLYIWGGGWGDPGTGANNDSCVIGYQSSWNSFFSVHKDENYDYTKYRYNYGKGLDCSGFAGWTLYNTLYTKRNQGYVMRQSTEVASYYASKGWATLSTSSKNANYYPGDVVSMSGHVWISLGECSDGSVLVIHSSPKGVQISGTSGKAYTLAQRYMRKYFPKWPYDARCVGSGYTSYVGKAKWKIGALLSDPDGIQNMSGEKVLEFFLGKV